MEAWGLTDSGMVREQNQDSYDIVQMDDGALLCIVCDGMGGAKSGNVASRLACEVFVNEIQRIYRHGSGEEAVRQALLAAASLANTTVFEQSKLGPDFDGMGDDSGSGHGVAGIHAGGQHWRQPRLSSEPGGHSPDYNGPLRGRGYGPARRAHTAAGAGSSTEKSHHPAQWARNPE